MTTIVYRQGVLCSDSLVVQDGIRVGIVEKVWKTSTGTLCGWAGTLNDHANFRKWTEGGCEGRFKQDGEGEGIVIQPNGQVFIVDGKEEACLAPLLSAFTALGSGAALAMGAMAVGVQAEQALIAAIALDIYSGGERQVLKTPARIEAEEAMKKAEADAAATKAGVPTQAETDTALATVLKMPRKARRAAAAQAKKKPDDQATA